MFNAVLQGYLEIRVLVAMRFCMCRVVKQMMKARLSLGRQLATHNRQRNSTNTIAFTVHAGVDVTSAEKIDILTGHMQLLLQWNLSHTHTGELFLSPPISKYSDRVCCGRTGNVAATAKCRRNTLMGLPSGVVSCAGLNGVAPVL